MPFDLKQLRYAVAAADHRSFHRAAHALGIEQSNLSRHVRKLEHVIGASLFIRSRAGVTATAAGEVFLRDARRIVEQSAHMIATARAAGQGRAGRLALGHNNPVSAGHLRATLLAWRDSQPDVEVDRIEGEPDSLIASLNAGVLDLAILIGETRYAGMRRATLWSERLLVALPASHPLATNEHIELFDLRDDTILIAAEDSGSEARDMMAGCFRAAGITPTIRVQQVSHESILTMLGAGGGVTFTCEGATGATYPDVVLREVHGIQGQRWLGFSGYWRREIENPALRRFLAFMRTRYSLSFDID